MGVMDGYYSRRRQSRSKAMAEAKQATLEQQEKREGYQAQIDAANDALDEYKKKVYDKVKSGTITEEAAANQLQSYYAKYFQPAVKEPSYQLDLMTSDVHHWNNWKNENTVNSLYDRIMKLPKDEYFSKPYKGQYVYGAPGTRENDLKHFEKVIGDYKRRAGWIASAVAYGGVSKDKAIKYLNDQKFMTKTQSRADLLKALGTTTAAIDKGWNEEWKANKTTGVHPKKRKAMNSLLEGLSSTNILKVGINTGLIKHVEKIGQLNEVASGSDALSVHDYLLQTEKKVLENFENSFKEAWGSSDWKNDSRLANYINSEKFSGNKEGPFLKNVLGESKYDSLISDLKKAESAGNYVPVSSTELGTFQAPPQKKKGINLFKVFDKGLSGIVDFIGDAAEIALDVGVGIITAPFEAPVAIIEGIDDIIDGDKSVGTALWDMTKQSFGVDDIEDAVNNFADGNYVDAYLNTQEFASGVQGGGPLQTDVTEPNIPNLYMESVADEIEKKDDGIIGDLKEDIDKDVLEPVLEATGLIPPMEEETPTGEGFDMDTSDINTLKQLKELLGILPGDDRPGVVIDALLGAERDEMGLFKKPSVEKMASNLDIMNVLGQQRQVAETGYDAGERETLSSRARRELAGRARAGGMAAGAAAGGLRGASVGAQARSLEEKAMQQQADVTTEMDKASIARKDAARQALANLAKDVTRFDIEKAEDLKKRKGATTIGVQSLISQEELMKKQLELAAKG